jgi:hypothetical protein
MEMGTEGQRKAIGLGKKLLKPIESVDEVKNSCENEP